jgi:nucleoside triphosphate diphosphatase
MGNRDRQSAMARRAARSLARLVRTMSTLRSPAGCPWDREQTPESLRPFLLEETYEALEAIDRGDLDGLRGELGDVLFQCVFQSQIAFEAGRFEIADAIDAVTTKLVRRHPHVFTPAGRPLGRRGRQQRKARTSRAVVEQWEAIKAKEQADAGQKKRLLAGVPRSLPALLRAHEIGTRVAAVGFDWVKTADVVDKIDEEVRELRGALAEGAARAAEEMGDLLFTVANLARKLGVEPESALRAANEKFTGRFQALEASFEAGGRTIHDAAPEEMEAAWQQVKAAWHRVKTRSIPPSGSSARREASAPRRSGRRSR